MKRLFLGSAVALTFLAVDVTAETACRDYRTQLEHKQKNLSSVVTADRSVLPSVTFPEGSPSDTFAIKGTFCDSRLEPLTGHSLRIVRIARGEAVGDRAIPGDALSAGLVEELDSIEVETSKVGKFLVSGLVSGEYVLAVDWSDLGAREFVVFDLRHIPGPPLVNAVEQIGLLKP